MHQPRNRLPHAIAGPGRGGRLFSGLLVLGLTAGLSAVEEDASMQWSAWGDEWVWTESVGGEKDHGGRFEHIGDYYHLEFAHDYAFDPDYGWVDAVDVDVDRHYDYYDDLFAEVDFDRAIELDHELPEHGVSVRSYYRTGDGTWTAEDAGEDSQP